MIKLNRWGIACAGILLQMAIGAVYAWSVFRVPLAKEFHWSISQVTVAFTITILMAGLASFSGGLWSKRVGPRVVALTGGVLYGGGVFLTSFSYHGLWWLYLSYGVIAGTGVGFANIVPIAVLVRWFPERRGLLTGVVVGGFGSGALITAPIATRLMQRVGVLHTFADLGLVFLLIGVVTASRMRNPPEGWRPQGWTPSPRQLEQSSAKSFTLGEALKTWQWWAMWLLLFLNTSAGISVISQESPIFQEFAKTTAMVAAGMVGIVSLGNALGRVFWASASDLLGRRTTFTLMFLAQIGLFWLFPSLHSIASVAGISFLILMCYGGGFGTMPAFAADYFGPANVGSIYGLILTAWGVATVFGALLIAHLRQASGSYVSGLHAIAGVMALSAVLPVLVKPPLPAK
jgi:MFS transporter, OFA family, oxalate/formate antiporter